MTQTEWAAVRVNDPDPCPAERSASSTPGKACPEAHPEGWLCTRAFEHGDLHVAGNGHVVCKVWRAGSET